MVMLVPPSWADENPKTSAARGLAEFYVILGKTPGTSRKPALARVGNSVILELAGLTP